MKSTKKIFVFLIAILSLLLVSCQEPVVVNKEYVRLEVATEPSKLAYVEGEQFDATGAKFEAVYLTDDVESKVDVTSKVTFDKTTLSVEDTKVVVTYKDGQVERDAEIAITVRAVLNEYLRLEMTTAPTKTTYIEEEVFDPAGAKFEAVFNTETGEVKKDVSSKVTFNKTTLKLGDEEITASYVEGGAIHRVKVPIVVNPKAELITSEGLIMARPTTGLIIEVPSAKGDAISHWFTEYKTDALYIKVIVEDDSLDEGTSVYNADGIEVSVFGCAREDGLADGTLLINASISELVVMIADAGEFTTLAEHNIERVFKKVSFGGKYVEGYQIELTIPYVDASIDETAVFYPGLYNNAGAMANTAYYDEFNTNGNKTNTFVHIVEDNTYEEHPWAQLGFVFGNYKDLMAVPTWDLTNDDGAVDSYIELTAITAHTDNNVYAFRKQAPEMLMKVKLSAKEVFNDEKYGKIGVTLTSLDGKDGLFFFIDAYGNGTNMIGTRVCVVKREDGVWKWPEQQLHVLDNANVYQNGNFVEMGIYRVGSIVEFFVNGVSVGIKSGFPGIEEGEALFGLASFNITMIAKEYVVTDDETILEPYRHEPANVTNLFLGDSYVDTAFWKDFNCVFGSESVNIGVGGTKTTDWIDSMVAYSTLYIPQNIIVHIGVNDVNDGGIEGEVVLERVEQLFAVMRELFPTVNIYYISIEPNNFRPENDDKYQVVNNGVKAMTQDYIHYVDTRTLLGGVAGTAVAHYFMNDGLHLNPDGYGLWNKAIKEALGIEHVGAQGSLGDYGDYARSGGWQFHEGYVENIGGWEQQIYFEGAKGTTYGVKVDVSALEVLNADAYPKFGFANKAKSKTTLFFFDAIGGLTNNWGNYVTRASGGDWNWGGIGGRMFVNLGSVAYLNNFKTLEFIRLGDAYYWISDGIVVQYAEGLFGTEETQLSFMMFNIKLQLKNAKVYNATELETRLGELEIAEKKGSKIDGNLSDWNETVLANPAYIYGSGGRTITYYMYMEEDGLYIGVVGLHNTAPKMGSGNWWENTNIEIKLGEGQQRFAAANGMYSRREGGGTRDVGMAVWNHSMEGELHKSTCELVIPWSMIDEYSYTNLFIMIGVAWKQLSEEGNIWAGGDFWYVPEADPGMRNIKVSKTGVVRGTELAMDGDLVDWDATLLANAKTSTDGEREFTVQAYLGADGVYGFAKVVCTNPLNINTTFVAGEWYQNPNYEVWVNDQHARIMMYGGDVRATGRVQDVGFSYDNSTNTLIIEYFMPFYAVGTPETHVFRIGSNSLNGGWYMPVDPNTTITENGIQ